MSARVVQRNAVPGIRVDDRDLRTRELNQSCIQFSLPLPVQDPVATAKALAATSTFVKDMIIIDKRNAVEVTIALVWRVIETDDELDRVGAWFLIDQIVRDAINEENIPVDQRCLSPCISNLIRAMPSLIRCRWGEQTATNPMFAKPYVNMRRNWLTLLSTETKAAFEEAFKEVKEKGLVPVRIHDEQSPFRIEAKYRDALWKLKLKQPRPSLALSVKQLFEAPLPVVDASSSADAAAHNHSDSHQHGIIPSGHAASGSPLAVANDAAHNTNASTTNGGAATITVGDTTITLKHSAAAAALRAHANVSGVATNKNALQQDAAVVQQNSASTATTIADLRRVLSRTGPRVHDRIRKWIAAVDSPNASYCLGCDVWEHPEKNCPCLLPPRSKNITRRQAANLLIDAGVSAPAVGTIGQADDLQAVSEAVDVIFQHIVRRSPDWTLLVDAFDVLRQRFSDVNQRRALLLLASYNLPPSKALIDNLGNSNRDQTFGKEFFRAREVLFKNRRLVELQKLSRAVLTLTCAYINPDLSSDERYREAIQKVRSTKSFLFCLHGVSSVPFGYYAADGRPMIEGSGFSDGDTCVFAPRGAGERPFLTMIENADAVRPLTDCPEQVDLLKSVVHHLSRVSLEPLPYRKKKDLVGLSSSSLNETEESDPAMFAVDPSDPQQEPWDFYVGRSILNEHGLTGCRWPQDEDRINDRIRNIADPRERLRVETAVWLLVKRKVPLCHECNSYGHHKNRCMTAHRKILGKIGISQFEIRLFHSRYLALARDMIDGRCDYREEPVYGQTDRAAARKDGFALRDVCQFYEDSAFPQEFADAVEEIRQFKDDKIINLSLCQYFPQAAVKYAEQEGLQMFIPKITVISSPEFPAVCLFCSRFDHDSSRCPTFGSYEERRGVGLLDSDNNFSKGSSLIIRTPYDKLFQMLSDRGVSLRDYCHAMTLLNESNGGNNNNNNASQSFSQTQTQQQKSSGLFSLTQHGAAHLASHNNNNPRLQAAKDAVMEIERLSMMETGVAGGSQSQQQQQQSMMMGDSFQYNSATGGYSNSQYSSQQQPGYEFNNYDDFYQTNTAAAQNRMERFGTFVQQDANQNQQQQPQGGAVPAQQQQQQRPPQSALGVAKQQFDEFISLQMNMVQMMMPTTTTNASSSQQQNDTTTAANPYDNLFYDTTQQQQQQSQPSLSQYGSTTKISKPSSSSFLSGFSLSHVVKKKETNKQQEEENEESTSTTTKNNNNQEQNSRTGEQQGGSFENLSLEEQQRLALEASDNIMMQQQQQQQQHQTDSASLDQDQYNEYDSIMNMDNVVADENQNQNMNNNSNMMMNNSQIQHHDQQQQPNSGNNSNEYVANADEIGFFDTVVDNNNQQQQQQTEQDLFDSILTATKDAQQNYQDHQQEQQQQQEKSSTSPPSRRSRDNELINEETGAPIEGSNADDDKNKNVAASEEELAALLDA